MTHGQQARPETYTEPMVIIKTAFHALHTFLSVLVVSLLLLQLPCLCRSHFRENRLVAAATFHPRSLDAVRSCAGPRHVGTGSRNLFFIRNLPCHLNLLTFPFLPFPV